jgi:hypothetical protein
MLFAMCVCQPRPSNFHRPPPPPKGGPAHQSACYQSRPCVALSHPPQPHCPTRCPARLKYLLACGSPVVAPDSTWREFWYHLLRSGDNIVVTEPRASPSRCSSAGWEPWPATAFFSVFCWGLPIPLPCIKMLSLVGVPRHRLPKHQTLLPQSRATTGATTLPTWRQSCSKTTRWPSGSGRRGPLW